MDITPCPKCKGLVIKDVFLQADQWLPGFRCVNCGLIKIDEEKVIQNANKETNRRTHKLDELQLYRASRRYPERNSYSVQHK